MKKITDEQIKSMKQMGGAEYARSEAWDIQQGAQALGFIAALATNEVNEPQDIQTLSDIMLSLLEFIRGEIDEMEKAAQQGEMYTAPAVVKSAPESPLNLSYAKSLGVALPDMAVKYVARDKIRHPVFLWGDQKNTDLEREFFTRDTDFWDAVLGKSIRPLTWDHAQDPDFDADPLIGKTIEWEDDETGRWAISQMEKGHKYRKAIDALIEKKALGSAAIASLNFPIVGSSSDSAPQYVKRVKVGKSTWLARWPWFATALTPAPCEPRMIDSDKGVAFIKSLGIALPEASGTAWEWQKLQAKKLKITSI